MVADAKALSLLVRFPADFALSDVDDDLHGFYQPETCHVLVLPADKPVAGCINLTSGNKSLGLQATPHQGGWRFSANGRSCEARAYNLDVDLSSRNAGLLETAAMRESGVAICGCGSVGSLAALDLARSGVGRFLLIDDDILSIENLCRHQCGLTDVGRFKAQAVADRIRLINPLADINVHITTIERLDPVVVKDFSNSLNNQSKNQPTLLLAAADSRRADRYGAQLAVQLNLAFLSIGLWERAFAGEIFYWYPEEPMPCYGCAFGKLNGDLANQTKQKRRYYSNETKAEHMNFEPGIAIDIAYVVQVGLKLAIDLLNRNNLCHVKRLLGHLSQYTLVCNSNDHQLGGDAAEIFSHPLQVTNSIQVEYTQKCTTCGWDS